MHPFHGVCCLGIAKLLSSKIQRNKMMKHLEKELYEAPQISKLVLNNDLSLLITFSVEGNVDDIEDGGEW